MPILSSKAEQSVMRRILLATGPQWWKRGLVFGPVFGIPVAIGGYAVALPWAPCGAAAIATGVVGGLLIPFVADALLPRTRISADRRSPVSELLSGVGNAESGKCAASPIRQRLAEEQGRLARLDAERERRGDSGFGKATEDRIVWGELLELELQDIDEQLSRIRGVVSGATGRPHAALLCREKRELPLQRGHQGG
jgi:hypothetical protein